MNHEKSVPPIVHQGVLDGMPKVTPDETVGIGPDGHLIKKNKPHKDSGETKVSKNKQPKKNSGDPDWWHNY